MKKNLIVIREELMDKVDQLLDSAWPDRKGNSFINGMKESLEKMIEIANRMELEGINGVELSKTYSYIGQIYSGLVPALGKEMLLRAKEAYMRAEKLLEKSNDEVAKAKLNFNFANTLRQIDPNDVNLLLEAKKRFESAKSCFSLQSPQYLPRVEEGLSSVNNLLAIAPLASKVAGKTSQLEKISEEINKRGDVSGIFKEFQDMKEQNGDVAGLIGEIYGILNKLSVNPENQNKMQDILQSLNRVAGMAAGGTRNVDPEYSDVFKALIDRLNKDKKSGIVDAGRAETLKSLIDKMASIQMAPESSGNESVEDLLTKSQEQRDMITSHFELIHYLSHGINRPPQGSKASAMVERCWLLRRFLMEEMSQTGKGPDESKYLLDLNIKAVSVDKHIYEAGANDERADSIDFDELRPLALEIRKFSSRNYPMVARPIWSNIDIPVDVKKLFFSGIPEQEHRFNSLMANSGYTLLDQPQGHSFAESRWRQMLKSTTTVFDLRSAEGQHLAGITYELGIAITIGKPVVIVIDENVHLPFDIEINPVVITNDHDEAQILINAIDQSLSWTYPRPSGKSFLSTLDYILNTYQRPNPDTYADQTLRMLIEQKKVNDPLAIDRMINKLFEYLNDGKTMIIHPVFPPVYPESGKKRVFHITPFRPAWVKQTTARIRATCINNNVEYIRGDEAGDANVIRSIWSEIAKASHIVADLTGFNANVALEIGISHTLGRPTLLIGQKKTLDSIFPMLSKLRVQPYNKPEELDECIQKFLK